MNDADGSGPGNTSTRTDTAEARVPWLGFRLVFGLVNGGLWFVIPFVMVYWLAGTMATERLVEARDLVVTVPAFFVAVFGLAGCLPAAAQQAKAGTFRMPIDPTPTSSRRGILGPLWLVAPIAGIVYFVVGRVVVSRLPGAATTPFALASRAGLLAAAFSFVQASTVSGSLVLFDLRPNRAATFGWGRVAYRTGVPQGLANALLMVLFTVAQGTSGADATSPFVRDIFVSCLGIGGLALAGGGGILGADLATGRIVGTPSRVPSLVMRVAWVGVIALLVTLPCALVAALCGGAGPVLRLVANGWAGGASAFFVGTVAGHWALASAANAESQRG